ncbi:LacI family DNA-binding transcriptional regulator [Piscinibacter koreensis]|uniref:LacI family DNA-binding transcriptional regulator n=1 Tax=Piscinibacter koreensis TaxID=2742824 RepID=A0A7Y6TYE0_9BURK|nr:LacI family DNA-binding transcriptional regulator [Schlegelella koreensis]NUZ07997.1 LacI family DNA-binding transcriptional regulator [Schlegelella koreensis]
MTNDARATLLDVARVAGVSLATVDRVLNKRAGVHARTAERVAAAVRTLHYRPDPAAARLSRSRAHRVRFILPSGSNAFVAMLKEQIGANAPWMADHRVAAETVEVDVFEPERLAAQLRAAAGHCETVVVMALDHPLVRAAIDELEDAGTGVVTLVSDVPTSRRHHFVGIDNVAAGRTAATLLGRFAGARSGPVGIVLGSMSLRDHAERHFGFNQVMTAEYPGLRVLPPLEGKDDSRLTERLAGELLQREPGLVGIYSGGAGNRGIAAALQAAGRADRVVFVAHELTPPARRFLLDGTLDAVLHQDPGHEIRSALRMALARRTSEPVMADQERIRIDIYLRDNLP